MESRVRTLQAVGHAKAFAATRAAHLAKADVLSSQRAGLLFGLLELASLAWSKLSSNGWFWFPNPIRCGKSQAQDVP